MNARTKDRSRASTGRAPSRRFFIAEALVLGLASALLPLRALAGCEVQTLELPVKMVGGRAIATVGINGTKVPLAVDSGAFFSFLTEAAATQLKLPLTAAFGLRIEGLTGRVDAYTTRVDKLQFFKGDISRVDFVVGGNEPGAGAMGLMGRNLLSFTDTEYDLAHGVIRFLFPGDDCAKANMAYWAGSSPVTDIDLLPDVGNRKTPAIRAEVKLNGRELVALFDTGATTLVSARAARRAGITDAAMTLTGSMRGAGRGSAKVYTAAFDRFDIGGEAILNNRLQVADFDTAGVDLLLGIDFFLSHRIYVSKRQSKMFFTYNGGPVFFSNKTETASAAGPGAESAASGSEALSADQLARRGAASAARNDFESALADVNRACELEPTSAELFAQRGAIQQALKRPAKALEDFDRALELDPNSVDARARRAGVRYRAKNLDGAKADLDLLDKTLAPQAPLRLEMSYLYLNLDQPRQALAQLNQWIPAHPHEAGREAALNSRCWSRARLGIELKEALDDCDDAIDIDPKNANYLDSRGWVYLRSGRFDKALPDFDRSIEARPGSAYPLYGRALTKMRLGDTAQGEADLSAARKLQPDIDRLVMRSGLLTAPTP